MHLPKEWNAATGPMDPNDCLEAGHCIIPLWCDGQEIIRITNYQGIPIPGREHEADHKDRLGSQGIRYIHEMERLKGIPPSYTHKEKRQLER